MNLLTGYTTEVWVNRTAKNLRVSCRPRLAMALEYRNKVLCFLSPNFPENGFTGESFLLIEGGTMKEMGIKVAGQMLIKKLRVEVRTCVHVFVFIRKQFNSCDLFDRLRPLLKMETHCLALLQQMM